MTVRQKHSHVSKGSREQRHDYNPTESFASSSECVFPVCMLFSTLHRMLR